MQPSIGRIVHYVSKTGNYIMPAMIVATQASLWPEGVERGDVPAITNPDNVHLLCFTAGNQVQYKEFDVAFDPGQVDDKTYATGNYKPGTWHWPPRV